MKTTLPILCLWLLFALLVACQAPGDGKKAIAAKKHGDEIVRALNAYRATHGRYPGSLDEIGNPSLPIDKKPGSGELSYIYTPRGEDAYSLFFKYFGPGSNLCAHESSQEVGEWECSGSH